MIKNFKQFLWFQFPAIAWMAAIFIQSSISYLNVPDLGFSAQDKLAHAIEYAILGWLLIRALLFQQNLKIRKNALRIALVIGSCYGISDEIHQAFVPGRSGDVGDIIADILGVFIVAGFYFIRKKFANVDVAKK